MKHNMIRAIWASIDSTILILYWLTRKSRRTSLPEWMSLNWGFHCVPLIQIVQLVAIQVNTTKRRGHPGAKKRSWDAGDAGDGGWSCLYPKSRSPPSGQMNIMNVHNDYIGVYVILFYSILFVSSTLCFIVLKNATCDVLQNYQSVCLATCEGSRNNARPTSWDSPPRPGVSSKS